MDIIDKMVSSSVYGVMGDTISQCMRSWRAYEEHAATDLYVPEYKSSALAKNCIDIVSLLYKDAYRERATAEFMECISNYQKGYYAESKAFFLRTHAPHCPTKTKSFTETCEIFEEAIRVSESKCFIIADFEQFVVVGRLFKDDTIRFYWFFEHGPLWDIGYRGTAEGWAFSYWWNVNHGIPLSNRFPDPPLPGETERHPIHPEAVLYYLIEDMFGVPKYVKII